MVDCDKNLSSITTISARGVRSEDIHGSAMSRNLHVDGLILTMIRPTRGDPTIGKFNSIRTIEPRLAVPAIGSCGDITGDRAHS